MKKVKHKKTQEEIDEMYEDDCPLCQMLKEAEKRGEVFEVEIEREPDEPWIN